LMKTRSGVTPMRFRRLREAHAKSKRSGEVMLDHAKRD
jgi:hypothetical protein